MFIRYFIFLVMITGCADKAPNRKKKDGEGDSSVYQWTKLADAATYLPSSHLQFLNIRDTVWAFHPDGIFYSTNGSTFRPSSFDAKIPKPGISDYIFFNNKLVAFGSFDQSNGKKQFRRVTYTSVDLRHWDVTACSLPLRERYHPVIFKGKIWIFGGTDSTERYSDAWNSADAVHWNKVADSLPFDYTENLLILVYRKKLLALSTSCFQSEDGIKWKQLDKAFAPSMKGRTPVVFNDMIWLFGCATNPHHACVIYSQDARKWDSLQSPWTHRASPAACVFRARVLLSSGSVSTFSKNRFSDSLLNDVWQFGNLKKTNTY